MSGPYYKATAPKLFERYGAEFVETRINPFCEKVRTAVTLRPNGGRCEYVEVSNQTTEDRVVAFADFTDGLRLWYREDKLDEPLVDVWNAQRRHETVPY